jgi:hypothetical protein
LGIAAGLAWGDAAAKTVVYVDRGISQGMIFGIKRAHAVERPVEYRRLGAPDSLAPGPKQNPLSPAVDPTLAGGPVTDLE